MNIFFFKNFVKVQMELTFSTTRLDKEQFTHQKQSIFALLSEIGKNKLFSNVG